MDDIAMTRADRSCPAYAAVQLKRCRRCRRGNTHPQPHTKRGNRMMQTEVTESELALARIREVLRAPDLYDSFNSVTTRCLVRDIKEAMGLSLNGINVVEPRPDKYMQAAAQIATEAIRARAKFAPFNSSHEGYAVIAEELDELWDDVKANNVEHSIAEAVQVGAMALRYIADMRLRHEELA